MSRYWVCAGAGGWGVGRVAGAPLPPAALTGQTHTIVHASRQAACVIHQSRVDGRCRQKTRRTHALHSRPTFQPMGRPRKGQPARALDLPRTQPLPLCGRERLPCRHKHTPTPFCPSHRPRLTPPLAHLASCPLPRLSPPPSAPSSPAPHASIPCTAGGTLPGPPAGRGAHPLPQE